MAPKFPKAQKQDVPSQCDGLLGLEASRVESEFSISHSQVVLVVQKVRTGAEVMERDKREYLITQNREREIVRVPKFGPHDTSRRLSI